MSDTCPTDCGCDGAPSRGHGGERRSRGPTRAEIVDAVADVLDADRAMCRPHHRELGRRVADRLLPREEAPRAAEPASKPPEPPVRRPRKPAESVLTRRPPGSYGPLVLDVSHWQGPIDWQAVASDAQDIAAVIVRTGDGKTPDRRTVENLQGAKGAGLPVGAYHYLRGSHSADLQLGVALGQLERAGVPLDLPLCPDVEGHTDPDGSGPRKASGIFQDLRPDVVEDVDRALLVTRGFAKGAHAALGLEPWLYTGQTWRGVIWPARIDDTAEADRIYLASLPLWLAIGSRRHVPQPWGVPLMVQYTARARVRGIDGPVDLSRYYGPGLPARR